MITGTITAHSSTTLFVQVSELELISLALIPSIPPSAPVWIGQEQNIPGRLIQITNPKIIPSILQHLSIGEIQRQEYMERTAEILQVTVDNLPSIQIPPPFDQVTKLQIFCISSLGAES